MRWLTPERLSILPWPRATKATSSTISLTYGAMRGAPAASPDRAVHASWLVIAMPSRRVCG